MDAIGVQTMKLLKANRCRLTPQQYKTIKGQVLAGNTEGAEKGLRKLLKRSEPPRVY